MLKYRTKLSLLVIVLLPLLVGLGFWQLSRYEQKLMLEHMLDDRLTMPALSYSELKHFSDPMYLPVSVKGRFDAQRIFFRDNQVHEGQAGYEVIAPFITHDEQVLLVNRGWIASESRETLPTLNSPDGEMELTGRIYRPLGKAFTLGPDNWDEAWPKRTQTLDFERMGKALDHQIPAYLLVLNKHEPGALQIRPLTLKTTSGKHMGYAIQWFIMSLVLLGLYLQQMIRYRK